MLSIVIHQSAMSVQTMRRRIERKDLVCHTFSDFSAAKLRLSLFKICLLRSWNMKHQRVTDWHDLKATTSRRSSSSKRCAAYTCTYINLYLLFIGRLVHGMDGWGCFYQPRRYGLVKGRAVVVLGTFWS